MRTIALSILWLSSPLAAAPGGGLIADQTAGTQVATDNQTHTITGGTARGGNLLHSFREFNVETGETAAFQTVPQTQQIISRVTGGHHSWINGTIRIENSQADLYLVNPAGMIFGRDAELDVPGAFHASTADYVVLADGQSVSADPGQGVNLTVAAPESFGFLDASVGDIRVKGSTLYVNPGKAIDLIGGAITLASDTWLEAAGGRIHLTAVASAGEVTQTGAYINDKVPTRADISIQDSILNTDNQDDSTTTGRIRLQGARVGISGSSVQASNVSTHNPQGDAVTLDADTQLILDNSTIDLGVFNSGDGGNLVIRAAEIQLTNNATIFSDISDAGQGGSVTLNADRQVVLDNSKIERLASATGDGGRLVIEAPEIRLTNGTRLYSDTSGAGQGGSVTLDAASQVVLDQQAVIITATTDDRTIDPGQGGALMIRAPLITLHSGAELYAQTFGTGQGGVVTLTATETIQLSGQNTVISSASHGSGDAGKIALQADHVLLTDGASVQSTSGFNPPLDIDPDTLPDVPRTGAAGALDIQARKTIELHAGSLFGTDASQVQGGNINIQARDWLRLRNSAITTSVQGGEGQGGNITIDPIFVILENSPIQANAYGGPGGNITLVADYLLLSGLSVIEASSARSVSGEVSVRAVPVDGGSLQAVAGIQPLNVTQWVSVPCRERHDRIGHLIVTGYDAYPAPADDLLSAVSVRATSAATR